MGKMGGLALAPASSYTEAIAGLRHDVTAGRVLGPRTGPPDAPDDHQMGERRIHRLALPIPLRPPTHPEPQAPLGGHRGHRHLWHGLRLRWPDRHPSLGVQPPRLAAIVPPPCQRDSLPR